MFNKLPMHEAVPTEETFQSYREAIRNHREVLIDSASRDMKRQFAETSWLEWSQVDSAFKFLESSRKLFKVQKVSSAYRFVMGRRSVWRRRVPVGRVLIVGTWNFPLGLHLPQILFALAAGNEVVFKPSPLAPATGEAIGKALAVCKKFSVWLPKSDEECINEIKTGAFNLVMFTGGSHAAKVFARACAESLTPLVAEASGVESAVLTENGMQKFEDHVDHLLWGIFHNSGQTCIAPRLWFVPRRHLRSAVKLSITQLELCPSSVAHSRPALKGRHVTQEQAAFESWLLDQGIKLEHHFSQNRHFSIWSLENLARLATYPPAAFGPTAVLVGYDRMQDVVNWLNHSPWSLMTAVFGEAANEEGLALQTLETSVVSHNEAVVAAGDSAVSLGGRRNSGYGYCRGIEGLQQLSRVQTWVDAKPWFRIKKTLMRPGLQNIEKLNYLNSLTWPLWSKRKKVKDASS